MKEPKTFDPKAFSLTEAALSHFKKSMSKEEGSLGVRFSVEEAAGCSGYMYEMNFVEENKKDDLIFKFNELKVFIDPKSFAYLKGTKVDFIQEGLNEEVKFLNPNVKAVCGCGESFEIS
tara:strand:- start:967 stop:1323 length:357 start_codon:yes stop_codon:yes gene_type:complete